MYVHIYSQDMNVLLLSVRRTPLLGDRSTVINGASERRNNIFLQRINDKLSPDKSGASINWHALVRTGHIHGKGNNGCFAMFMKANPTIMIAIAGVGQGD